MIYKSSSVMLPPSSLLFICLINLYKYESCDISERKLASSVLLFALSRPNNLFFKIASVSFSYCFLSYGNTPTRFNVSQISTVLIFLSSGLELDKEGEIFTSRSHGLSLESSKISNPNSSKHTLLCLVQRLVVVTT